MLFNFKDLVAKQHSTTNFIKQAIIIHYLGNIIRMLDIHIIGLYQECMYVPRHLGTRLECMMMSLHTADILTTLHDYIDKQLAWSVTVSAEAGV